MRYARSRAVVSSGALAAVLFAGSVPALAQDAGAPEATSASSEIIVTAQRRVERSVDVPISVTALGAEQLATANVQELSDISKITPSLRFDTTGAFAQPTIRGVGTANTDTSGYHNTITRAYLRGIRMFLEGADLGRPVHTLVNELLTSPMGGRDWPLRFWSKERLMSVEARRGWVEPDLAAMP